MTDPAIDLPPLPKPASIDPGRFGVIFSDAQMTAFGQECARAATERAASLCEMTSAEILLLAGEMSAGELRCVQAVLKSRAAAIRKG